MAIKYQLYPLPFWNFLSSFPYFPFFHYPTHVFFHLSFSQFLNLFFFLIIPPVLSLPLAPLPASLSQFIFFLLSLLLLSLSWANQLLCCFTSRFEIIVGQRNTCMYERESVVSPECPRAFPFVQVCVSFCVSAYACVSGDCRWVSPKYVHDFLKVNVDCCLCLCSTRCFIALLN